MAEEIERVYTVPLRTNKNVPRTKRSPHAIKAIREYVANHMHSEKKDVWIDPSVAERIWSRGLKKAPTSIRIKVIKFEDEQVEVSLPEE